MALFKNQTFRRQQIILDDNTYASCAFEGCVLIYRGGIVKFVWAFACVTSLHHKNPDPSLRLG